MLMQRMAVFYETLYKDQSASLSAGAVCHVINKLGDCSRQVLNGTLCRMITKSSDRDGINIHSFIYSASHQLLYQSFQCMAGEYQADPP